MKSSNLLALRRALPVAPLIYDNDIMVYFDVNKHARRALCMDSNESIELMDYLIHLGFTFNMDFLKDLLHNKNHNPELFKYLMARRTSTPDEFNSLLNSCVLFEKMDELKYLLSVGARPQHNTFLGRDECKCAFHYACEFGRFNMFFEMLKHSSVDYYARRCGFKKAFNYWAKNRVCMDVFEHMITNIFTDEKDRAFALEAAALGRIYKIVRYLVSNNMVNYDTKVNALMHAMLVVPNQIVLNYLMTEAGIKSESIDEVSEILRISGTRFGCIDKYPQNTIKPEPIIIIFESNYSATSSLTCNCIFFKH